MPNPSYISQDIVRFPGGLAMAKTGPLAAPATILVAEDSADTRALLIRALSAHGYRVVEAADGREAVELAVSECPDLVVMDLNMPIMDGFAATERIRELKDRCGEIPVVAVTAFDTYGMRDAAQEVGCNAYLLKPLALDELESVIAGLLTA
jgi:CheY-like chemotaxis protein